ncbi:MAG: ATP-binding protein [Balneolaceae bacterium]
MIPAKGVKEFNDQLIEANDRLKVLSSAIVYGRNASGKSNLLRALKAIQFLATSSSELKVGERIPPYEPFKLDGKSHQMPIRLKIEFLAKDDLKYVFEIEYTEKRIEYEKMSFYPKGQPAILYERLAGEEIRYGDYMTGRKKDIESLLYENQSFLSKVGADRIPQLKEPYMFFEQYLYLSIFHDTDYDDALIQVFTQKLNEDDIPHFKNNMNKLIKVADTGIQDIIVKEVDIDVSKLPEDMDEEDKRKFVERFKHQIRTIHPLYVDGIREGQIEFRLNDESTGTLKLLAIGGLILEAISDGSVLVVDELDKSLHPKLTKALINIFNSPITNPKKAQLIFATHDVSLLSSDLFRRDQIWFVEKELEGYSYTYAISDIQGVRPDVPYDKWYMNGKFGGMPVINEKELDFQF